MRKERKRKYESEHESRNSVGSASFKANKLNFDKQPVDEQSINSSSALINTTASTSTSIFNHVPNGPRRDDKYDRNLETYITDEDLSAFAGTLFEHLAARPEVLLKLLGHADLARMFLRHARDRCPDNLCQPEVKRRLIGVIHLSSLLAFVQRLCNGLSVRKFYYVTDAMIKKLGIPECAGHKIANDHLGFGEGRRRTKGNTVRLPPNANWRWSWNADVRNRIYREAVALAMLLVEPPIRLDYQKWVSIFRMEDNKKVFSRFCKDIGCQIKKIQGKCITVTFGEL